MASLVASSNGNSARLSIAANLLPITGIPNTWQAGKRRITTCASVGASLATRCGSSAVKLPLPHQGPRTARARAASAARPASCLRPGWPRSAARSAAAGMKWETSVAGAVGSAALGSHFGASL